VTGRFAGVLEEATIRIELMCAACRHHSHAKIWLCRALCSAAAVHCVKKPAAGDPTAPGAWLGDLVDATRNVSRP
jgi:hypothetical protein